MNKPTVESVELLYIDRRKEFALVLNVDAITHMQHVLIENGINKFLLAARGKDIANQVGVEFINKTKEDITISGGGVTCEQIKALGENQRIIADNCIIYKSPMPENYYFTYVDGCPSVCDTAEEISEAVNTLNGINTNN